MRRAQRELAEVSERITVSMSTVCQAEALVADAMREAEDANARALAEKLEREDVAAGAEDAEERAKAAEARVAAADARVAAAERDKVEEINSSQTDDWFRWQRKRAWLFFKTRRWVLTRKRHRSIPCQTTADNRIAASQADVQRLQKVRLP